jgi:predicted AAA+ superfamily ATPase
MESIKEIFKTIIRDNQQRFPVGLHPRRADIPVETDRMITLTGARRTGKTFTQFQSINRLLDQQKADPSQIVYVNLEDDRLFPLSLEKLGILPEAYYELYPNNRQTRVWFFFDEIQIVPEWERFVRRLHDSENCQILLTGSSSSLLSREIATRLRGRTLSYEIFPFSFPEVADFYQIPADLHASDSTAKLRHAMHQYLESGGFPEIIQAASNKQAPGIYQKIWQEYIDLILFKDIIERHQVSNTWLLKYYLKFLLTNSSNLISIQKIYRDFKSQGIKVSKNSLYEYLAYMEEAYALFTVPLYTHNLREQQRNPRKIYPLDIGLKRAVSGNRDAGRDLEALVFQQLRRFYPDIYYWKGNQEVDFLVPEQSGIEDLPVLLNVSATLENIETRNREISGLKEAASELGLSKCFLITLDEEETLNTRQPGGDLLEIKIMPYWKWCFNVE